MFPLRQPCSMQLSARAPRMYAKSSTDIVYLRLSQMSLRHYIQDHHKTCMATGFVGTSVAPYVAFDYNTCDENAQCIENTCICNPPYVGTGTLCLST